jgi:hypothetical protein
MFRPIVGGLERGGAMRFPERLGRTVYGGVTAGGGARRTTRVLGPIAILGLSLVLAPTVSANAASLTWAGSSPGRTESAAHWSAGANWVGDTAPTTSQALETLTFPHLTSSECTVPSPPDTCYLTLNDVGNLSAESLQLDDADDYLLAGEGIALGKGGLTASPETSGSAGNFIEMPLRLSEPQRWRIANHSGGAVEENGVFLNGEVTGSSPLTAELTNGSTLILDNETEVGPVTIEGPVATGEHIKENGSVLLEGELNSTDRQAVNLRQVFFGGTGAVGPLAMNDATLDVGSETEPTEGLEAASVKLDSSSGVLFEIMGSGTTAQVDYSQIVSDGPVELDGGISVVVGKPTAKASCPVLTPGQQYTFLSTIGTLSGSFSNAPENGPEIPIDLSKECGGRSQTMRIGYDRSGGTETVTGTVEGGILESVKREAERITAKTEEERKRTAEAAAVAAAQKQAEQRKLEEEALARVEHEEEATVATGSVLLAGSTITAQGSGEAVIKLACAGTTKCAGKLTLTAESVTKKGKKAKTEIVGTANFSIPPNETTSIKLTLNAAGKALLSADHGRLGATLSILKSSPSPSETHADSVHLVQQKAHDKTRK